MKKSTRPWQSVLTGALLLLVGAAVGAIGVKLSGNGSAPGQPPESHGVAEAGNAPEKAPQALEDGVLVYLFHGNFRCPTCLKIEATTKKVVETRFAKELYSGKVIMRELNYEEPANREYITKYQLIAPTVVMVRIRNGKEEYFANLLQVWDLIHSEPRFWDFIETTLQKFLRDEPT